jgi:hypothetical protein
MENLTRQEIKLIQDSLILFRDLNEAMFEDYKDSPNDMADHVEEFEQMKILPSLLQKFG